MIHQFDQVVAIYNPPIVADLKPSVVPVIGEIGVWYAAWLTGDDEPNAPSEWAMSPQHYPKWRQSRLRGDFCWVALSELGILEILEGHPREVDAARRVRHWRKQMAGACKAVKARAAATVGTEFVEGKEWAW